MTPSSFPHVRLTPKAEARAIRHGFPWVYANELVLDRRTRAIAPGALAILEDSERRPLGVVAFNGQSKIICRMLDRDPEAVVDQAWFEARFARALAHRPSIVIADEPTAALDPAMAREVMGLMLDLVRGWGAAMVIASHDHVLLEQFAVPRLTLEIGADADGPVTCITGITA